MKKEEALTPKGTAPSYRQLPTQWVFLGEDGRLLSTSVSRMDGKQIANAIGEDERFYMAKCHYRIGATGEREYITNLSMVPEALKMRPEPEDANATTIENRLVYGQKQW